MGSGRRVLVYLGWGAAAVSVGLPWEVGAPGVPDVAGWQTAPGRSLALVLVATAVVGGLGWLRRRRGLTVPVVVQPLFSSAVVFGLGLWWLVELSWSGGAAGPGALLNFVAAAALGIGGLWQSLRRSWPASGETRLRMAVLWRGTILRERIFDAAQPITIGTEPGVTFIVPDGDGVVPVVPLLRTGPHGSALTIPPDAVGRLSLGGHEAPVQEHRAREGGAVQLRLGDWGLLHAGPLSIFMQQVVPERRPASMPVFDGNTFASAAVSSAVHVGMILAALFFWEETAEVERRPLMFREASYELVLTETLDPLEEPVEEDTRDQTARQGDDGAGGDEFDPASLGSEGEDLNPVEDWKPVEFPEGPRYRGPANSAPPAPRSLADLIGGQGTAIKSVLGNSRGLSDKLATAMEGTGGEAYAGMGSGSGIGFSGRRGGGGQGGWKRLGKIFGDGNAIRTTLRPKQARRVTRIKAGQGRSAGGCQRGDIAKRVRRAASSFRVCYEQRLLTAPNLSGRLTMRWTIGTGGRVSGITAVQNGLDSRMAQCVARAIRRMRFTPPTSGSCVVQWPFLFDAPR